MLGMHKLLERLERLERRAATRTGCHCSKVVWHDEEVPETCPHGWPWFLVVRIVYEEGPAHA
jgi:hypothetical protein